MNTVSDLVIERVAPEETYKSKAYTALKQAITNMDIYSSPEPAWLDERQLSERLGVSRTPVREALAMLEQEGFVKSLPRRGIIVVKKTKREIVEMVQAWAALESMAARLITLNATDEAIKTLRPLMQAFGEAHKPREHLGEYSSANIAFHQAIIRLSGSRMLADMTDNLLLHVRGIRQITIGRDNRAERSIQDHLGVIGAIEQRDTERAERLSREHTLGLAAYVEQYGDKFFD
jgi:DNA-binding GntR family transcriptional regulator